MYNTPPCFAVYTVQLVLKWLEETIGGLAEMEALNRKKAKILYDIFDSSDFYRGTAEPASRSLMNVTFRLPSEELEKTFVKKQRKTIWMASRGIARWAAAEHHSTTPSA